MIVLAWLAQEPCKWKTFVSNRVAEIQRLTANASWGHVSSGDNPADLISRGVAAVQLTNNKFWWSGPDWLTQVSNNWPKENVIHFDDLPEAKKINMLSYLTVETFDIFKQFSNFNKLRNVVAYCHRFVDNLRKNKSDKIFGTLTVNEVSKSLITLSKLAQKEYFFREIHDLQTKGFISKKSKLLTLTPFLDNDGILRVGGRLRNSNFPISKKCPILLPGNHSFTKLIIINEHERTLHGGVQTVLSSVRETYWPLNGKNSVKGVIRGCLKCFKAKPTEITPMMGDLPRSRLTPSRPFYTCGVDFAGPILVKDGTLRTRKLVKTYICLFVCFSTRAVHLELAGDLSTHSFLNSLKRFFARRGISRNIYSDNGLNFVGADNYIQDVQALLTKVTSDIQIRNYFLDNSINWSFIPPRAPHFGGLWESAVKVAKHHLQRVLGNTNLTYEHLNTVLCQIESILNSRPICPMSNDPNDYDILSPGHFLIGSKLTAVPEEDVQGIPCNRLDKYRQLTQIVQHFWKRWSLEYIHNLQQRQKWKMSDPNILRPGALVLLKEPDLPPYNWKIGRIEEVYPGQDNVARVALIKTSTGSYKRAFNRICVLPIEQDINEKHV